MATCTDMQVLWKCCGLHSALHGVLTAPVYSKCESATESSHQILFMVSSRSEMRCPALAHSIHPHTYSPSAATAARKKTQTTFVVVRVSVATIVGP